VQTRVIALFLSLIAAAGVVARADRQEQIPLRKSFAAFPLQLGDWRGAPQAPLDDKVVAVLGVDDYLTRAYFKPNGEGVGLYIGYWQSQRQGDTIHSPQNCLPGAGWLPVTQGQLTLSGQSSDVRRPITVNRYLIQKGLDRQMVLYWYQSHGRIVASEYWGKIFMVTDAVRLNRTDGAVVRVITPILGDSTEAETSAEARAVGFVGALLPLLDQFLPL
jgi:EpsI family protein